MPNLSDDAEISSMDCVLPSPALLVEQSSLPQDLITTLQNATSEQLLTSLSGHALDPQCTRDVFAFFEPLAPEICARWPRKSSIPIIAALGRALPALPQLEDLARDILSHGGERADLLQELDSARSAAKDLGQPAPLRELLTGVLRLVSFDNHAFAPHIQPARLQVLLHDEDRVIRYLAIRILVKYMHASDSALESMVARYLGDDDITGFYESKTIDYRFWTLWEESRLREFADISNRLSKDTHSDAIIHRRFRTQDFSSQIAIVADKLLFVPGKPTNGLPTGDFISTPTTDANLKILAAAVDSKESVLILGQSGCGKTHLLNHLSQKLGKANELVTLHLNEQSDAKLLIGIYATGPQPGTFEWRPGVLTTAVREGRWVLIEDLDRAPVDVMSTVIPLIERREIVIPSRGETIAAASSFKVFATVRTHVNLHGEENDYSSRSPGGRLWRRMHFKSFDENDLRIIIAKRFPSLEAYLPQILACYRTTRNAIARSRNGHASRLSRQVTPRELFKWCERLTDTLLQATANRSDKLVPESFLDSMFLEAVDCFAGHLEQGPTRESVQAAVAQELHLDPQRRDYLSRDRQISFKHVKSHAGAHIAVGRTGLPFQVQRLSKDGPTSSPFATNRHTLRVLERIAVSIRQQEPILLVGETGIGKTTAIQHLSSALGHKLIAINLSQQSESGDLLGGYKPLNVSSLAIPLKDEFQVLFETTFSQKKNQKFMQMLGKCVARSQWKRAVVLWREALKMVDEALKKQLQSSEQRDDQEQLSKRRKLDGLTQPVDKAAWDLFTNKLAVLEKQLSSSTKESMIFSFVEGKLVTAVRQGHWVLLDEINLATPDTLECLSELLETGPDASRSLILSETGSTERIKAHPNFRIFAAMNPSNDVGKKDLPPGIRSRFTEFYVESPDHDLQSLQGIVSVYLERSGQQKPDKRLPSLVAELYQQIQHTTKEQGLVDGSNQPPIFSLRTLSRALSHAVTVSHLCTIKRAIYEGFALCFFTSLDVRSEEIVKTLVKTKLFGSTVSAQAELKRPLRNPTDESNFVQVALRVQPTDKKQVAREEKAWLPLGALEPLDPTDYIITEYISKNLQNLIRATSTRKYPVLIQGPTSAGKTSMVEYLAKRSGNTFVRINNHEHTDLQEYLGTYVSTPDGQIVFQEGVLVEALRKGSWVVLDELNLAPTDVLEALNRLLDDNRELLIPETQELVRPHPNFMLFATQNPAGPYGGRKVLSRAFRNRFIELHFDDIPVEELNIILARRSNLPESWCALIVEVYKQLARLRQKSRVFEQNSFATLRDLFRWAFRGADSVEQLAIIGYMLLAEKVRRPEERHSVKLVLEKHMSRKGTKVVIDEDLIYGSMFQNEIETYGSESQSKIVWTNAMRRLYILVTQAIKHNEAVLLVGETGCGKTTVCQMIAEAHYKQLHIVNAHQNLETGDLIGAQRPRRNRAAVETQLRDEIMRALGICGRAHLAHTTDMEQLLAIMQKLDAADVAKIPSELLSNIDSLKAKVKALFEWQDGSIVRAMKEGQYFLLDEISLADDSVLERLNSVLDPQRTMLLAEKGAEGAFVSATPGFQFFGTMNPGGDYGKKELSPALRNRFTEIWVPPMTEDEDMLQLVGQKLNSEVRVAAQAMIEFGKWFEKRFKPLKESTLSIRDMLTWVDFVNNCNLPTEEALFEGALLVYIDTLGANPSSVLALRDQHLQAEKMACRLRLAELLGKESLAASEVVPQAKVTLQHIQFGPFQLQRYAQRDMQEAAFTFDAPTTRKNATRIARGLQLKRPLLLEGNPGVGKTSIVGALAIAVGKPLFRLNLSEQTDIMDLFGSDVPVENAAAGVFAWRDAPFLAAMKRGDWVLLDEMNLASQSVLEGLNACLDHRAEVYIPELEQRFQRHPEFRLFAAQNPHSQGGGRKGLPASFVNRFTVIYMDVLEHEDLLQICNRVAGSLDKSVLSGLISFVTTLDTEVATHRKFGARGSPWEFNLRDCLRCLQLLSHEDGLLAGCDVPYALNMLFMQRFRTTKDCAATVRLAEASLAWTTENRSLYTSITPKTLQIGYGILHRSAVSSGPPNQSRLRAKGGLGLLESIMVSVQMKWPVLLVGPSGSGKSSLVQSLAAAIGTQLEIFPLSADIDASDLVGGYEQVDKTRHEQRILRQLLGTVREAWFASVSAEQNASLSRALADLYALVARGTASAHEVLEAVNSLPNVPALRAAHGLCHEFVNSKEALASHTDARFEWVDGTLVTALENGNWLLLDNANMCSASVLDRLNSLLESGGSLILNEHCNPDGSPKLIVPHPNFRLFLTVDPQYGEISRAMRNRTVELFVSGQEPDGTSAYAQLLLESSVARFDELCYTNSRLAEGASGEAMLGSAMDGLAIGDVKMLPSFAAQIEAGLVPARDNPTRIRTVSLDRYQAAVNNEHHYKRLMEAYGSVTSKVPAIDNIALLPINAIGNEPLVHLDGSAMLEALWAVHLSLNTLAEIQKYEPQQQLTRKKNASKKDSRVRARRLGQVLFAGLQGWCSDPLTIDRFSSDLILLFSFLAACLRQLYATSSSEVIDIYAIETLARHLHQHLQSLVIRHGNLSPFIEPCVKAVEDFGVSRDLTSGLYLDFLWEQLRPKLPATKAGIEARVQLEGIADRLDALSVRVRMSFRELLPLRQSIVRALSTKQADVKLEVDPLKSIEMDLSSPDDDADDIAAPVAPRRAFVSSAKSIMSSCILAKDEYTKTDSLDIVEMMAGLSTRQKAQLQQENALMRHFDMISSCVELQGEHSQLDTITLGLLSDLSSIDKIGLDDLHLLRDDLNTMSSFIAEKTRLMCQDPQTLLTKAFQQASTGFQDVFADYTGAGQLAIDRVPARISESQDTAQATQELGKAYIDFASHCIRLFTPNKPHDPAMARIVARQIHSQQQDDLVRHRQASERVSTLLSGFPETLEASRLTHYINQLGPLPEDTKVFRPSHSRLGELQPHFLGALRVAEAATTMLTADAKESLCSRALEDLEQVVDRLTHFDPAYRDLTEPLVKFLHVMQLGLSLLRASISQSTHEQSAVSFLLSRLPFCSVQAEKTLSEDFHAPRRDVSETIDILPFVNFCRSIADAKSRREFGTLSEATSSHFALFHQAWSARLQRDQKAAEQASSTYVYRGAAEDEEIDDEAVQEMFTSFQTQTKAFGQGLTAQATPQALAVAAARQHIAIYLDSKNSDQLLEQALALLGSKPALKELATLAPAESLLPMAIMQLAHHKDALQQSIDTRTYNIFVDTNITEVTRVSRLAAEVKARAGEIRKVWPEQATLQNIIIDCNGILSMAWTDPVMAYLPRVEKLHANLAQWQSIASREFTLVTWFDQATQLIISWRRLELSTWARLLEAEEEKMQSQAFEWWFPLFESVLIVPSTSEYEPSLDATSELLSTLEQFLSGSTLGQFQQRFDMVASLHCHCVEVGQGQAHFVHISESMLNLLDDHSRFIDPVKKAMADRRQELEKQVKEVILLASWKDTNVEALKQSSRVSHRKLFRIVHKFQEFLQSPVQVVLEQTRSNTEPRVAAEVHMALGQNGSPKVINSHASSLLQHAEPCWVRRPTRYKQVAATLSLLASKLRASEEPLPFAEQLSEFADDIVNTAKELRKDTPATATEENAPTVKHLTSRKRKLFADALKELRRMGFGWNQNPATLQKQTSKAQVLAQLPSRFVKLSHPLSLFEVLDIMPKVRASVRDHCDEVNASDLLRSVGLFEGLLSLAIQTTKRAFAHGKTCHDLELLQQQTRLLWKNDTSACSLPSKIATDDRYASLVEFVSRLLPVLKVGVNLLRSQSALGGPDLGPLIQELQQHCSRFDNLRAKADITQSPPLGLQSTEQQSLAAEISLGQEQLNQLLAGQIEQFPNAAVTLRHIMQWSTIPLRTDISAVVDAACDLEDFDQKLYECLDLCLAAAQDVEKVYREAQPCIDDNGWVLATAQWFETVLSAFNAEKIHHASLAVQSILPRLKTRQDLELASASLATSLPLMQTHLEAYRRLIYDFHKFESTIWGTHARLAGLFCSVASQGFCRPSDPSNEKGEAGEKLEGGTGLGEGEGAENISKEIGDDEDMSELAQENQDGGDKEQDGDNDDAVDIDDDLKNAMGKDVDNGEAEEEKERGDDAEMEDEKGEAGDDANADGTEGQEKGQDDAMDEGVGKVDDFEPSAVDEKMWDDAANDEPEKQGKQDTKTQESDEQAASREEEKGQEEKDKGNEGDNPEQDEQSDGMSGDELEEEGEGEDDNPEGGKEELGAMDPHLEDTDALHLPDDMQLDGDKKDEGADDLDGDLDMPDDLDEQAQGEPETEMQDSIEDADDVNNELQPDQAGDDNEKDNDDANQALDADRNPNDASAEDAEDEKTGGTEASKGGRQSDKNPEAEDNDNEDGEGEDREDAQDEADQQGQQSSNRGHGPSQASKPEPQSRADAKDRESIKKLGDVLDKWHRQQREIQEASTEDMGQQEQQDVDMADADFEHLPDDDTKPDAQALGASTQEQARALDQDNQVGQPDQPDDDKPETFQAEEADSDGDREMEDAIDAAPALDNPQPDSRDTTKPKNQAQDKPDLDVDEPDDTSSTSNADDDLQLSPLTLHTDPQALWAHYEALTTPLAHSLTESLRLILEPTLATKLRGDFRTGKRLNIKRIIPFIASGYKRDKIWLRRSIPSKRAYQVLLALDDSKSMGGRAADLALQTLALVGRSLSMLEVGEIGVLGFGQATTTAHELGAPLTSDAGAAMMGAFSFAQGRTDVRRLLADSFALLDAARLRARGAQDLWQLELVISDGICEDHEGIRRLLLRAHAMRVMVIFVVVDAGAQTSASAGKQPVDTSITELERVEFVAGPPGADGQPGPPRLVRHKYLDSFPFGYYLIVQDVEELPAVLSQALRQWFAEVAER